MFIDGKLFSIGHPKTLPPLPAGWTLRTSIMDYPAMIDPQGVEWLIAKDGVLHEVKPTPTCDRRLTRRTRNPNDLAHGAAGGEQQPKTH